MLGRLVLCLAFAASAVLGVWQRTVYAGKGLVTESSPPHDLSYFKSHYSCARPDDTALRDDLSCVSGDPGSPETEPFQLGEIAGDKVYELWYSRATGLNRHRDVRSVLIQTADDQYREIDVVGWIACAESFPSTEILELDGNPVLITEFRDCGQNNNISKTPYLFRDGVPEKIDFSAVTKAIRDLTPPHMGFVIENQDFAHMTDTVELYRDDINLPRVLVKERGRVVVTYRFLGGKVQITGAHYEAYSLP